MLNNIDYDKNIIELYKLDYICGIDEVGRGAIAGPFCVAAVVFEKDIFIDGITDSKKLDCDKITKLYEEIDKKSIYKKVLVYNPVEIDQCGIQLINKNSIEELIKDIKKRFDNIAFIVDGTIIKSHDNIISESKHDLNSHSCGAASIYAKHNRDLLMENLQIKFSQYNLTEHKGYLTNKHLNEIKQYGKQKGLHRYSYKISTQSKQFKISNFK